MEIYAKKTGPGNRKCEVCGEEITDYREHRMLSHICTPGTHPLGEFNYLHFHRTHVDLWDRKAEFLMCLENAYRADLLSEEDALRIGRYVGLDVSELLTSR